MLKSSGIFARALSIILMLTLAACGGGGGDGGGGGGSGFSVKVDRNTASFNYAQGATPSTTVLNVTWTGTPPAQLYLLAQDDANALNPNIPIYIGSTSATVTIQPKAALSAGTYTGHLILNVCVDPQCIQEWSGSPMSVSYTVTVTAPVFTGPTASSFPYTLGQTLSTSFNVQLILPANSGSWTATATAPWLILSATSGTGAATILVGGDGHGMAVGNYTGSVTVTSANGSQTATFTLQVSRPTIQTSPSTANFSGINGTSFNPVPVTVAFMAGILPMTVTVDQPWIVVSQVLQPVPPASASFSVSVNPSVGPLMSGSYTGNVHVTVGSGSDTTSIDFPVSLTLTAPTLTVSPQSVVLGGSAGRDFSPATLSLSLNTGTNAYPWTVSGQSSWLSLSATSGASPGQIVLTPMRANSSPGTAGATLNFSATVNGDVVTASVPVKFNLDSHRLIAAENGVALVSTPAANWSRLTHEVNIRSNYGLAVPWTAQSDQAWLQVTQSGTGGGKLTLTANPTGLATDQLHTATVTVASSDASVVNTEQIRVGLWVASAAPSSNKSFTGTAQFNAVAADPIRPYVYAHETNSTSVRVFNLYTETELAPITGLPATTVSLTVSNDGNTLFALGSGYLSTPPTSNVIASTNLNTGVASGTLNTPASPNTSFPANFIRYVRTGGREFIMDSAGRTFRTTDGSQAGNGGFGYYPVTTDGSAMFEVASRYALDYTDAGGGIFSVSGNPTIASTPVDESSRVGDVTNVDGSRACGPYKNGMNCFNGDGSALFTLAGGGVWTNNTAMGADGRLYFGTTPETASDKDVFVYSATGALLTNFQSNPYGLGDRTLVVSSDGFVLAMATPFGQPSSVIITPIGP